MKTHDITLRDTKSRILATSGYGSKFEQPRADSFAELCFSVYSTQLKGED